MWSFISFVIPLKNIWVFYNFRKKVFIAALILINAKIISTIINNNIIMMTMIIIINITNKNTSHKKLLISFRNS